MLRNFIVLLPATEEVKRIYLKHVGNTKVKHISYIKFPSEKRSPDEVPRSVIITRDYNMNFCEDVLILSHTNVKYTCNRSYLFGTNIFRHGKVH